MMKQVVVVLAATSFAQPDIASIIQRSVEANTVDWRAASDYDSFERGTETYEEHMTYDSPYGQVVAVNGKPLSPEQQAQEQQKLEAAIVERQKESPKQRVQRIARHERVRKRNYLLMEQLPRGFVFS
jgi:O-acetylhomoserine/O-acetylserine sulfhydrylase-like pyridoxal-dependent enzyme